MPREQQSKRSQAVVPLTTRLGLSAIAGCVTSTVCHPLDVIRVQLQSDNHQQSHETTTRQGKSGPWNTAKLVVERDGIRGLWAGLSAAYLRQFSYTSIRMGLYSFLLERSKRSLNQSTVTGNSFPVDSDSTKPNIAVHTVNVPFATKLLLGSVAGTVGSFIANPVEIAIVQMANDSKLPRELRRNDASSVHAIYRIATTEGVRGLMRGVVNSCLRAAVLNGASLGTYSQTKEFLVEAAPNVFPTTTSISTLFCGSVFSAFWAIGASMPLDVVKSR